MPPRTYYPKDPQLIEQMNEEQLAQPMQNRPHPEWFDRIMREWAEAKARRGQEAQPQNDGLSGYRGFGNAARSVAGAFLPGFQYGTPPGYTHRGRGVVGEDGPEVVEGQYTVTPLEAPAHSRDPAAMSMPAPQQPPPAPTSLSPAQAALQAHIGEGRPTTPEVHPLKRVLAGLAQGVPAGLSGLSRSRRGGYGGRGGGAVAGFMEGYTNPTPLWSPGHYQKVEQYDSTLADLQDQAALEGQVTGQVQDAENLELNRRRTEAYEAAQGAAKARAERPPAGPRPLAPPNTEEAMLVRTLSDPKATPEQKKAAQDRLNILKPGKTEEPEPVTASERQRAMARHQADPEKYPTWQDALPDARAKMGNENKEYARKRTAPKEEPTLSPEAEQAAEGRKDNELKRIDSEIRSELESLEAPMAGLSPERAKLFGDPDQERWRVIRKFAREAQKVQDDYEKELQSADKQPRQPFDMYQHVIDSWKSELGQEEADPLGIR